MVPPDRLRHHRHNVPLVIANLRRPGIPVQASEMGVVVGGGAGGGARGGRVRGRGAGAGAGRGAVQRVRGPRVLRGVRGGCVVRVAGGRRAMHPPRPLPRRRALTSQLPRTVRTVSSFPVCSCYGCGEGTSLL
jgi:hypothetical protein